MLSTGSEVNNQVWNGCISCCKGSGGYFQLRQVTQTATHSAAALHWDLMTLPVINTVQPISSCPSTVDLYWMLGFNGVYIKKLLLFDSQGLILRKADVCFLTFNISEKSWNQLIRIGGFLQCIDTLTTAAVLPPIPPKAHCPLDSTGAVLHVPSLHRETVINKERRPVYISTIKHLWHSWGWGGEKLNCGEVWI